MTFLKTRLFGLALPRPGREVDAPAAKEMMNSQAHFPWQVQRSCIPAVHRWNCGIKRKWTEEEKTNKADGGYLLLAVPIPSNLHILKPRRGYLIS